MIDANDKDHIIWIQWNPNTYESLYSIVSNQNIPTNSLERFESASSITLRRCSNLNDVMSIHCSKRREGTLVVNLNNLAMYPLVLKCSYEGCIAAVV